MQRNWIGKSGAKVRFKIENHPDQLEVFTTRPDTLYGVTFMTLAPELELVKAITTAEKRSCRDLYRKVCTAIRKRSYGRCQNH